MDRLPNQKDLLRVAASKRGKYLADLKAAIDRIVQAGGDVSYNEAIDAIHASVRFAAQVASVRDLS